MLWWTSGTGAELGGQEIYWELNPVKDTRRGQSKESLRPHHHSVNQQELTARIAHPASPVLGRSSMIGPPMVLS